MGRERLNPIDRPALVPDGDGSGLVVSFAVGPSGVGPVMGFGSDDFFPVAPVGDAETGQRSVGTRETGDSPVAEPRAGAVTSAEDEPVRGANERRGS
jgi:hypothetical protein